jgi:hypothetical protein
MCRSEALRQLIDRLLSCSAALRDNLLVTEEAAQLTLEFGGVVFGGQSWHVGLSIICASLPRIATETHAISSVRRISTQQHRT